MNPRFQIDELVTQDSRGVVFQGVDQETDKPVAMRRFLPSGGENIGLDPAKQEAYRKAVATMKQVSHPCLRDVLDGGCDAVDGMPYLVTRWSDGVVLREWMSVRGAPLSQETARYVISRLLDVCITLSASFEREALWVETALESVIVREEAAEGAMPGVSFWVCPWRWFGDKPGEDDWRAGVADFAESLLGGPGRAGADPRNASLLVWVQRIRHKEIASLRAAFAALKVPVDDKDGSASAPAVAEPAKPSSPFAAAAPRPATALTLPQPSRGNVRLPAAPANKGKGGLVAIAVCALALVGGGAWWFTRPPAPVAATGTATANAPDAPEISTPANRRQAVVDGMMGRIQDETAMAEERRQSIEKRGYYTIREADLLLDKAGSEVALRGRLANVRFSGSGLTMYLEFSSNPPREEPRAYAMRRDLVDGIREEDLKPLVGKLIEIRGPVELETVARTRRARVGLTSPDHLTVLPDEVDFDVR